MAQIQISPVLLHILMLIINKLLKIEAKKNIGLSKWINKKSSKRLESWGQV